MDTPREPSVVLESKPLDIPEDFESRRMIEEKIMAALRGENSNTIGICGVGGIGKTRMARRIGEKVKTDKLFKFVLMVRLGPNPDLKRIIYEISYYLGVRLEGGNILADANELHSKLLKEERILIILDDVRVILDLEKIGIPWQKRKGSCKIMLTSRFENVCLEMGADKIFTVQALTEEEAWILLREKAGHSIESSDLYPMARSLSHAFRWLPHAAIAIGRMLKVVSKLWPCTAAEKNLNPAFSYRCVQPQTLVYQLCPLLEKKVVDVLSFANSLPVTLEVVTVLKQENKSRQLSFSFLPPRRGRIKLDIFRRLMPLAFCAPQEYSVFTKGSSSMRDNVLVMKKLKLLNRIEVKQKLTGFSKLTKALAALDLQDTDIQVLPGEMKKLINLRYLNLTNCRNLQSIEPGLISSLVRLEELYMLGSFSEWEVQKEGKMARNASINELESLPDLTSLQIQIQNPNIIPKNSRIWSRLIVYVISTPEELKCQFQESLHLSVPAVNPQNCYWKFRRAMTSHIPSLIPLADWLCLILRSTEYLRLAGDGSKKAVDELIPEGFKLLKQLVIGNCSSMEYLVNGVYQVLPTNVLFPVLESLCLEDLPVFMGIFQGQLPAGLFGELRYLKLCKLPALLHVCPSPTVTLSNLRSVRISHCPKLWSLFSLSMAQDLTQLEEIRIEYCEMMEEIFSEERCGDAKISNKIEFSKLNYLELDTLPNITGFCKNVMIEFPKLREMHIQSLRKLITFCPDESSGSDDNNMQFLFNEKIAFGSLKKLKISEMDCVAGLWCHQPNTSLFGQLEELIVISCYVLRNLFSHSITNVLVQLQRLMVEDCNMLHEVIAEDGEMVQSEFNEALFPQLKRLELRRLPILESFSGMINGLELPSLEDLIIYDCPGMKEFSRGSLNMPMLKSVKRDHSTYRINAFYNSVQRLFNEKHLFVRQSLLLSSQYKGANVEDCMEEEVRKDLIHSHPELDSQVRAGNKGAGVQYDMSKKSSCSTSRQSSIITEDVDANPPKSCSVELAEEVGNDNVSARGLCVGINSNERKKGEICQEAKLEELLDKRYAENLILFFSVFPSGYKFTKDMLVWQWMAEGWVKLEKEEIMEEVCTGCFDTFLNLDYIVPSGYDHNVDQMKYKVGDRMNAFLQKQLLEPKYQKYLDSKQTDVAKVEHLSLAFREIDHINFEILKMSSRLQSLFIHGCYGSKVKHLPSDLFLEMKSLKVLNLSHSDIVELPSSVDYLEELRYLDMSETPIRWLPESIHCLSNLQTLKLDGCLNLYGLPRSTNKLINLHHLVFDVCQLQSMPIGMGNLSKLRTLLAFLVGEDDGCRIGELKDMNKLKGSLRLLNLENVRSKEEAEMASLFKKLDLKKIELQWSDLQDEKNPDEEEVLKSLKPPSGIQELKILFYSGGVLPSWISNPSFSEVVSVTLYRCRYCNSLPSLGELPSLKLLDIVEINEVIEISSSFCRKQINQHHKAFPKLEKLSLDSMSKLELWTGMESGDFPCLRQLVIKYCPKFIGLPLLSHLTSLLHMELNCCPELSCLPEGGLPPALESFMIKDCPKLKERCYNVKCEDWSKVTRVPALYFDNQKVSV